MFILFNNICLIVLLFLKFLSIYLLVMIVMFVDFIMRFVLWLYCCKLILFRFMRLVIKREYILLFRNMCKGRMLSSFLIVMELWMFFW